MAFKDYYATLGLAPDASPEAIRLVFRRQARRYHPDLNREAEAEAQFKAIKDGL